MFNKMKPLGHLCYILILILCDGVEYRRTQTLLSTTKKLVTLSPPVMPKRDKIGFYRLIKPKLANSIRSNKVETKLDFSENHNINLQSSQNFQPFSFESKSDEAHKKTGDSDEDISHSASTVTATGRIKPPTTTITKISSQSMRTTSTPLPIGLSIETSKWLPKLDRKPKTDKDDIESSVWSNDDLTEKEAITSTTNSIMKNVKRVTASSESQDRMLLQTKATVSTENTKQDSIETSVQSINQYIASQTSTQSPSASPTTRFLAEFYKPKLGKKSRLDQNNVEANPWSCDDTLKQKRIATAKSLKSNEASTKWNTRNKQNPLQTAQTIRTTRETPVQLIINCESISQPLVCPTTQSMRESVISENAQFSSSSLRIETLTASESQPSISTTEQTIEQTLSSLSFTSNCGKIETNGNCSAKLFRLGLGRKFSSERNDVELNTRIINNLSKETTIKTNSSFSTVTQLKPTETLITNTETSTLKATIIETTSQTLYPINESAISKNPTHVLSSITTKAIGTQVLNENISRTFYEITTLPNITTKVSQTKSQISFSTQRALTGILTSGTTTTGNYKNFKNLFEQVTDKKLMDIENKSKSTAASYIDYDYEIDDRKYGQFFSQEYPHKNHISSTFPMSSTNSDQTTEFIKTYNLLSNRNAIPELRSVLRLKNISKDEIMGNDSNKESIIFHKNYVFSSSTTFQSLDNDFNLSSTQKHSNDTNSKNNLITWTGRIRPEKAKVNQSNNNYDTIVENNFDPTFNSSDYEYEDDLNSTKTLSQLNDPNANNTKDNNTTETNSISVVPAIKMSEIATLTTRTHSNESLISLNTTTFSNAPTNQQKNDSLIDTNIYYDDYESMATDDCQTTSTSRLNHILCYIANILEKAKSQANHTFQSGNSTPSVKDAKSGAIEQKPSVQTSTSISSTFLRNQTQSLSNIQVSTPSFLFTIGRYGDSPLKVSGEDQPIRQSYSHFGTNKPSSAEDPYQNVKNELSFMPIADKMREMAQEIESKSQIIEHNGYNKNKKKKINYLNNVKKYENNKKIVSMRVYDFKVYDFSFDDGSHPQIKGSINSDVNQDSEKKMAID